MAFMLHSSSLLFAVLFVDVSFLLPNARECKGENVDFFLYSGGQSAIISHHFTVEGSP
jgi:hypothetical protein